MRGAFVNVCGVTEISLVAHFAEALVAHDLGSGSDRRQRRLQFMRELCEMIRVEHRDSGALGAACGRFRSVSLWCDAIRSDNRCAWLQAGDSISGSPRG